MKSVMNLLPFVLAGAGLFPAAAASRGWEGIGDLAPGAPVQVVTAGGAERGEFAAITAESLTVRTSRGERRFARPEVVQVVSRQSHRTRNFLIGVGIGFAAALAADQTLGVYLRNESNPPGARAAIWTIPIAAGGAIGAALPGYRVIYRK